MTPKEITENGRNLSRAADALRRSARDLDALWESIGEALEDETFGGGEASADKKSDDSLGTDWVTPIWQDTYKIRKEGKEKIRGSITYAIRLCGTEDVPGVAPAWPWLDQACVLIFWHRGDAVWSPEDFEKSEASQVEHLGVGLWTWSADGANDRHFYVLPIFALKNEADVQRFVVKPLQKFFETDGTDVAADALRDVPALVPTE